MAREGVGDVEQTVLSSLAEMMRRRARLWLIAYDVACWFVAGVYFLLLRYQDWARIDWSTALAFTAAVAACYVAVGFGIGVLRGRARVASLDEAFLITVSAGLAAGILSVVNAFALWVPRSMPLGMGVAFVLAAAPGRALWRRLKERGGEWRRATGDANRVLLVGAGDSAIDLIHSMLRDPDREWRPVGMLDDDVAKRHLRVRNVHVLGAIRDLDRVVETHAVDVIVIAIPSASSELVQRVSDEARVLGVDVKVLPSTAQLLTEHVGIRDIRDINLTDVLGRNQLDTDIDSIADYLTGRRVLVTGAGGSIGSELCRQIHRFAPAELMMLDRDESALHAVQLSISGRALLDSGDVMLCDIRDLDALYRIFEERRPEVVFHAAALKHLPMLEQYPAEAVKTNVIGTRNVLLASRRVGVDRFVNISTDKAANPSSVLGYSKRIAERITARHAFEADAGTYLSVRFGNVLGSRGSVLTSFVKQVAAGGPVTVTDPEVTRYFMTIEEACQLVVQAAAIGEAGEALVLDMGEPVRIVDVAQQLIAQSGRHVPIEFTGLRPGEKLHEELFGDGEPQHVRPRHPYVSHVPVPRVTDAEVESLPWSGDRIEVTRALASLCLNLGASQRDPSASRDRNA